MQIPPESQLRTEPIPSRTRLWPQGGQLGVLVALAWLLSPNLSSAEPLRIGQTLVVVPAALSETEGKENILAVGSSVFADDVIRTETAGRAGLEFVDNTRFEVGPNSSAKLDRFVFNPDRTAQEAAISMGKGLFRFISGGRSPHGSYTLSTPHATLGVRGTDFIVIVTDADTLVIMLTGLVNACAKQGRDCRLLDPRGVNAARYFLDGHVEAVQGIRPPTVAPAGRGGGINAVPVNDLSQRIDSSTITVEGVFRSLIFPLSSNGGQNAEPTALTVPFSLDAARPRPVSPTSPEPGLAR